MYKICLVEDEKNLNNLIKSYLERADYEVIQYFNGTDALNHTDDSEMAERKLVISLFDSLIKKGIDKKLDAISKRGYYTKYKTAETEAERQEARLKYLDAVGMHEDFRF